MLLLGAWQGERISLLAVTQHPPSALETELAASTLMAASTLRIITELMFSPPQFHLLPGAACSSSWLLPTTGTIRTPAGHLIVSIIQAQPHTKQLPPHPRPHSTSNTACIPRAGISSPICTTRGGTSSVACIPGAGISSPTCTTRGGREGLWGTGRASVRK